MSRGAARADAPDYGEPARWIRAPVAVGAPEDEAVRSFVRVTTGPDAMTFPFSFKGCQWSGALAVSELAYSITATALPSLLGSQ